MKSADRFTICEHLSYDMVATWVYVRNQLRNTDDPEFRTYKDYHRMADALDMVIEPIHCRFIDIYPDIPQEFPWIFGNDRAH